MRNPHAVRENLGCLAFLPIAIGAAVAFGWAGFLIGQLLAGVFNNPDLPSRLAFLTGADGFALVCIVYSRTMGGPNAKTALEPLVVFFVFVLLGIKCGRGLGIGWVAVWGLANGVSGFLLALPLLPRFHRPIKDDRKAESPVR